MHDPYIRHVAYPKAATLANQADDARTLDEFRRPAVPPGICRHNRFWQNCRLCTREWDVRNGHVARRW
jgi:hypothetical protein